MSFGNLVESISSREFEVNVQMELTLSAGCTPVERETESVRERKMKKEEREW